jgi:choline kinase
VIILAAGRGSRLGSLGEDTPKWLLEVGGRTLADRQLEGIDRAAQAGAVASVRVVVGHAAEAIEAVLSARAKHLGVVRNPEFAELNNWWSVLRALRELPDDGPAVVINADLMADSEHVAGFLRAAAGGDADGLLAVDLERVLTDESMKVSDHLSARCAASARSRSRSPSGEYIGMLMARGPVLRRMRAALEAFVDRPEPSTSGTRARSAGRRRRRAVARLGPCEYELGGDRRRRRPRRRRGTGGAP